VIHGGALARTVVAATGTKTDTPVMDTPFNVQSASQQVFRDQQVAAARLGELLWQLRRELWPEYGADHPEYAGPAYERQQLGGGRQARILDGVGPPRSCREDLDKRDERSQNHNGLESRGSHDPFVHVVLQSGNFVLEFDFEPGDIRFELSLNRRDRT
jgi:hypothetical protein